MDVSNDDNKGDSNFLSPFGWRNLVFVDLGPRFDPTEGFNPDQRPVSYSGFNGPHKTHFPCLSQDPRPSQHPKFFGPDGTHF